MSSTTVNYRKPEWLGFNPRAEMKLESYTCNLRTIEDGRGGIFTWNPEAIVEWNLIYTRGGENRGFHFHTEFEEYVLVTSGEGVYTQWHPDLDPLTGGSGQYPFIKVNAGDCIYFPIGCPHTLTALTDMRMVAMLTRKWDDCHKPITRVQELPPYLEAAAQKFPKKSPG